MRGDVVLARAFEGKPLRRIVWEEKGEIVMIFHPDYYERALRGEDARPIGFPAEDVFEFDEALFKSLLAAVQRGGHDSLEGLWKQARPYRGGSLSR